MQGGIRTFKSSTGKSYKHKFTGNEKPGDVIAVEVGPIWSHNDFLKRKNEWQNMVPGWSMTGHWWTTVSCSMSVVQFKMAEVKKEVAKNPGPSSQKQPLNYLGFDYPENPSKDTNKNLTKDNSKKDLMKSKFSNIPTTPEDEQFVCPISQCIMEDPVITSCGHTFEHSYIKQWLGKNEHCPVCKKKINKDLVSNYSLKAIIESKYGNIKQKEEEKQFPEVKEEPELCYIALHGRTDYVFDVPYFQNRSKMDIFYLKKPHQNNKNQLFYKEKINENEFRILGKPQGDLCELAQDENNDLIIDKEIKRNTKFTLVDNILFCNDNICYISKNLYQGSHNLGNWGTKIGLNCDKNSLPLLVKFVPAL